MMKICVYGLAKDFEDRCDHYMQMVADADHVIIGDLGSTDSTVDKLRALGAEVVEISTIVDRFDVAKNMLIGSIKGDFDIAICCDLNQHIDRDWKNIISRSWISGTTKIRCLRRGTDQLIYWYEPAHVLREYYWERAIHERLSSNPVEQILTIGDLRITDLSDWLDPNDENRLIDALSISTNDGELLLKMAKLHASKGRWDDAVSTHMYNIDHGNSSIYRAESMRHMSGLQRSDSFKWFMRAAIETPWRREPWYDLMKYHHANGDWYLAVGCGMKACNMQRPAHHQFDDPVAWGSAFHDLLSDAAWKCELYDIALAQIFEASNLNPSDERLRNNYLICKSLIEAKTRTGEHK